MFPPLCFVVKSLKRLELVMITIGARGHPDLKLLQPLSRRVFSISSLFPCKCNTFCYKPLVKQIYYNNGQECDNSGGHKHCPIRVIFALECGKSHGQYFHFHGACHDQWPEEAVPVGHECECCKCCKCRF